MDELCTRGPGGDGRFEHSSAGQFSLGALFAAEPHRPRKGGILTAGNTEKLSAPILRRTGAPDGKSLYVSAPVPDADSGAGASCRGMHRWGLAGSGGGRRLRRPALGESAGRSPEALRTGGELAQLSVGVPSRLCRCPHDGRGRSSRQCGQWSAADGTLLSGSAGSGLRSAAAPLLSDAQHGLLRQL